MAFNNTPAPAGASKMKTRAENENSKGYVFQAFPTTFFHPDGRHVTVANAEEAAKMDKQWRERPYPPPPPPPVILEPTLAEVQAENAKLLAENAALQTAVAEAAQKLDASEAYGMERVAELADLKKKLNTKAAKGKADDPKKADDKE